MLDYMTYAVTATLPKPNMSAESSKLLGDAIGLAANPSPSRTCAHHCPGHAAGRPAKQVWMHVMRAMVAERSIVNLGL